jgi:hypothetical protein
VESEESSGASDQSDSDAGDSGSDGEPTQQVFVELRCDEGGYELDTSYVDYVFHGHDGEVMATGNLGLHGIAECPACSESFALTLRFEQDWDFDYTINFLTLAGLGAEDFYSIELCAPNHPTAQPTPYGSAVFTMPEDDAGEDLEYLLYTGGPSAIPLEPSAQHTRNYDWPSDGLTTSGEAVGFPPGNLRCPWATWPSPPARHCTSSMRTSTRAIAASVFR